MIYLKHPVAVMIVAFFMMVIGIALPMLMIMHIIESTFFLNFLAFGLSIGGLFVGLIGLSMVARKR
jgi:hypothetical protein